MNRPTAQEAERRVHGTRTVHLSFIEAAHGVGVVEKHPSRVVVQADSDSLRHGQDAAAVIPGGSTDGRFGDEKPPHADGDQREGLRYLETGIFAATVMPAVVVIPAWEAEGNYSQKKSGRTLNAPDKRYTAAGQILARNSLFFNVQNGIKLNKTCTNKMNII